MKNILPALILAATLSAGAHAQNTTPAATPAPVAAASNDLSIKVTSDYESEYVFRGKKVSDGAFEPSVDVSSPVGTDYGTVDAYVWANEPVGRREVSPGPNQPDEVDLGAQWKYDLGNISDPLKGLSTEIGDQYYWYPQVSGYGTVSRSDEVHISFDYEISRNGRPFHFPTFTYYHDFILDSNTLTLSDVETWDLSKLVLNNLSLVYTATIGWTGIHRAFGDQLPAGAGPNWRNSYYYGVITLDADYKIRDWCTLFIGVRVSGNSQGVGNGLGGPTVNPQAPGGGRNNVWGGVGLYLGF